MHKHEYSIFVYEKKINYHLPFSLLLFLWPFRLLPSLLIFLKKIIKIKKMLHSQIWTPFQIAISRKNKNILCTNTSTVCFLFLMLLQEGLIFIYEKPFLSLRGLGFSWRTVRLHVWFHVAGGTTFWTYTIAFFKPMNRCISQDTILIFLSMSYWLYLQIGM